MPTEKPNAKLWPHGATAALLAVPTILVALGALTLLLRRYLGWSVDTSDHLVLLAFAIMSAVPLGLLLLDYVATKGGVVGNAWLKIDFSKAVVETGSVRREVLSLPDNIVDATESITDSGGVKLLAEVRRAATEEIVCVDLKDGNIWWETRLLVLCAGAVGATGAGSRLRAIVFVGTLNNKERQFFGWSTPLQLLTALKESNQWYRVAANKATMTARQLAFFADPSLQPNLTLATILPAVKSYAWAYDDSEPVMLARLLLAELKASVRLPSPGLTAPTQVNLEDPPLRLTAGRFRDLFESFLYTDVVDRSKTNDEQLAQFLASTVPYVAIVRDGRYEGMLRSDLGVRAILRDIVTKNPSR